LQFSKIPLMGELEPQHNAAEPQGEKLVIIEVIVGVEKRKDAKYLRVRLYQDGYPTPRTQGASPRREQVQKLVALTWVRLRVAQWSSGSGPRAKVAESIFDIDRTPGQSMKGIYDALLAATCRQGRP
jgi:hypothetical protein